MACCGMQWNAMAYDGIRWHILAGCGNQHTIRCPIADGSVVAMVGELDSLRKQHYYEADRLLELEPISSRALPQRATSIPLHMCFFWLVDTYIHTYIHTQRWPAPMYIHIYTHTNICAFVHTCIHTHTYIYEYIHRWCSIRSNCCLIMRD